MASNVRLARNEHDVRALLSSADAAARLNSRDSTGGTVLMLAAEEGHAEIVRILLEDGRADVDLTDHYGDTALSLAHKFGQHALADTHAHSPRPPARPHSSLHTHTRTHAHTHARTHARA